MISDLCSSRLSLSGIMDQAYFVGRKEILAWLNDTYSLNLGKIEETASGAVACQIADSVFPGEGVCLSNL